MDKKRILRELRNKIAQNIAHLKAELNKLNEAYVEADAKGGDNFEGEKSEHPELLSQYAASLKKYSELLKQLENISANYDEIRSGTFFKSSDDRIFFLHPLAGGVDFVLDKERIIGVNTESPFGKQAYGKKTGDTLSMGKNQLEILEIC